MWCGVAPGAPAATDMRSRPSQRIVDAPSDDPSRRAAEPRIAVERAVDSAGRTRSRLAASTRYWMSRVQLGGLLIFSREVGLNRYLGQKPSLIREAALFLAVPSG